MIEIVTLIEIQCICSSAVTLFFNSASCPNRNLLLLSVDGARLLSLHISAAFLADTLVWRCIFPRCVRRYYLSNNSLIVLSIAVRAFIVYYCSAGVSRFQLSISPRTNMSCIVLNHGTLVRSMVRTRVV